jgi:lysozyme family protein
VKHPFEVLKADYAALWASMRFTRSLEIDRDAKKLIGYRDRYAPISNATKVPVVVIAAIHNRESNARFDCYLGNGQPLDRITTIVPKGRGPWTGADAFEQGAIDGLGMTGLASVADEPGGWSVERALYQEELWNGFGPRGHGINTGYLWAGTNHYGPPGAAPGKYVSDGKWDPRYIDRQLGTAPLMKAMAALAPDLALPGMDAAPVDQGREKIATAVPLGVGGVVHDTKWVQAALRKLGDDDLVADGSYGKWTAAAVRRFQKVAAITVDGVAGPATFGAIEKALTTKFGSVDL